MQQTDEIVNTLDRDGEHLHEITAAYTAFIREICHPANSWLDREKTERRASAKDLFWDQTTAIHLKQNSFQLGACSRTSHRIQRDLQRRE